MIWYRQEEQAPAGALTVPQTREAGQLGAHRIPIHPRHAVLVAAIQDYLLGTRQRADRFGSAIADNRNLVPDLKRGKHFPPHVLRPVFQRLIAYYEKRLIDQETEGRIL